VAIGSDDGDVRVGGSGDADVPVQPDPMGMSLSRLAAAQPDDFTPVVPVDEGTLALRLAGREWAHDELADAAVEAAGHHGMTGTSRVLTTAGYHTVDGLDAGLLVPLAAGGSVVLVTSADSTRLADRCATENVTHTAGVTVPGLDRLC